MPVIKKTIIVAVLIALIMATGGCIRVGEDQDSEYKTYNQQVLKKVGIVLSKPGMTEPGTNEAVVEGLKNATAELDAEYRVLAPGDLMNNEESLRYLAENEYDLILAIGRGLEEDLFKVASDYPDIKFAIFKGTVDQPNVTSIGFNMEEGAFMAGAAAASLTKSNLVGYVGGSMITDKKLEDGFARGVQYINTTEGRQVKVLASYAGVTEKGSNDPQKGKDLANNLYWNGCDVIFSAAGQVGIGVVSAATENRKIALASDPQLMSASPWNVYGSVSEKPEKTVFDIVEKAFKDELSGGKTGFGIKTGTVDFTLSQAALPEITNKLSNIKERIKKGDMKIYEIKIPQDMVTQFKLIPVNPNIQQVPGQSNNTNNPGTGNPGRNRTHQPSQRPENVQGSESSGQQNPSVPSGEQGNGTPSDTTSGGSSGGGGSGSNSPPNSSTEPINPDSPINPATPVVPNQ